MSLISPTSKEKFSQFKNQHILVIGDAMVDHYIYGSSDRVSPEAPVPIVLVNKEEHKLGGAANVAANIAKLGATVSLCSIAGNDKDGAILKKKVSQLGIDNKDIVLLKGRKTTVKTRVLSKNQQLIRIDSEDTAEIDNKTAKVLQERIEGIIDSSNVNAVVLQDYNKGMLNPVFVENLIDICKQKNIPVVVDPKKDNLNAFKHCTLFKPNLIEVEAMVGRSVNPININQLNKAAAEIFKQLENDIVVITLSEHGIYFCEKNGQGEIIKQKSMQVADVSGAGDTVISALALGIATSMDLKDNVALANLAAGYVCQLLTVEPITNEALKKLIH